MKKETKAAVVMPTNTSKKLYKWTDLEKPMRFLIIQAHVAMLNKPSELLTKVFNSVKPKVYITVKDEILKSATVHTDHVQQMKLFTKKLEK